MTERADEPQQRESRYRIIEIEELRGTFAISDDRLVSRGYAAQLLS